MLIGHTCGGIGTPNGLQYRLIAPPESATFPRSAIESASRPRVANRVHRHGQCGPSYRPRTHQTALPCRAGSGTRHSCSPVCLRLKVVGRRWQKNRPSGNRPGKQDSVRLTPPAGDFALTGAPTDLSPRAARPMRNQKPPAFRVHHGPPTATSRAVGIDAFGYEADSSRS